MKCNKWIKWIIMKVKMKWWNNNNNENMSNKIMK